MSDARGGVAAVGGARIAVIDDRRMAGLTVATGVADFVAVAAVGVRARPTRVRLVDDPDGRVARVDGARVAVIEAGRSARRTRTPNARLHAVAGVLITARRAIRDGGVSHADGGVASVHGARIAVVGSGSRTGLALALVVARRNAITEVTVVAQGAFRAIDVENAGDRIRTSRSCTDCHRR